jgi:uncharacterized RDD family membrane protein YckC
MTNVELQQKRLFAAAIDAGIGIGLILVAFVVWLLAAFIADWFWLRGLVSLLTCVVVLAYVLLRDILGGDRSIGKKIQQIRVVNTYGGAITLVESVKRNALFGIGLVAGIIGSFFQMIPFFACIAFCMGGPLVALASLASVAAVAVELVKILQEPAGVRFGDQFAKTRVVD